MGLGEIGSWRDGFGEMRSQRDGSMGRRDEFGEMGLWVGKMGRQAG